MRRSTENLLPRLSYNYGSALGGLIPNTGDLQLIYTQRLRYACYRYVLYLNYVSSPLLMLLFKSLFLGFSFYKADNTLQGLQNQTFSVFMLL